MDKYSLGHICLFTTDFERALHFYVDGLGFEEMFSMPFAGGRITNAYLRITKNQYLELFGNIPLEKPGRISFDHFCLHVADVVQVHKELTEKGLEVTPVEEGSTHCLKFYVTDPDGNKIEMMQLRPDSMQTIHDHD